MIPSYSESGKAAISTTTNSAYRAFLFFEDSGAERFYEEIVKKLTPDHKSVRVICLAGKPSLIAHCTNVRNQTVKRKSLYILDKDLDNIIGTVEADSQLHYLDKYSIENYLLEQTAIHKIVLEEKPKIANVEFNINEHLENLSPLLIELATLYLVCQEYYLDIPSCSEPIQRFAKNSAPWILCENKIASYREDVAVQLLLNEFANNDEEVDDIFITHSARLAGISDFPGKQLIDLIRLHLSHCFAFRAINRESFSYRLASACKFDELGQLRERIRRI